MKKEIIETSKGMFLVVDEKELPKIDKIIISNDSNFIKLSEIPEEQASEIVDCHKSLFGVPLETHVESLHSLLKSKGIKITNNTYIFKL